MNKPFNVPLLSVIIPTKDRYATLIPVVEAILSRVSDHRLEVVVQDNSGDNNEAGPLLQMARDSRLKYHHEAKPMSLNDNTSAAINHSTGEFVLFIGDDDIVSPEVMKDVRRLEESGLNCLIYATAKYWWGSVRFHKEDHYMRPFACCIPIAADAKCEVLRSEGNRRKVLNDGAASYYRLPRCYHGIVRRQVLEAIKERTGDYVPGASPDLALALAISYVEEKYLYINHPVTIFGSSSASGGGLTVSRNHHGRIEEQKHLPQKTIDGWSIDLPRYWSEFIVYPQTALEVLAAFGSREELSLPAAYATLIVNEYWLGLIAWPYAIRHCGWHLARWTRLLLVMAHRLAGRVKALLTAKFHVQKYSVTECAGPAECMDELSRRAAAGRWYGWDEKDSR